MNGAVDTYGPYRGTVVAHEVSVLKRDSNSDWRAAEQPLATMPSAPSGSLCRELVYSKAMPADGENRVDSVACRGKQEKGQHLKLPARNNQVQRWTLCCPKESYAGRTRCASAHNLSKGGYSAQNDSLLRANRGDIGHGLGNTGGCPKSAE